MIALESQVMEHSQNNLITDNDDLLQEDDEEEFALISRRIQRLMMRRNQIRNSSQNRRNNTRNESDLSKVQCYGCNQFGHYKNDCPKQRQKTPLKNKSMMATWDELDEALEDEEQLEAKMCLMTHSDSQE
ncbi:phytoalexin-deficient 4-2 protein, partial [Trifolium pratense]